MTALFFLMLAFIGMFFGLGMDEQVNRTVNTYSKQERATILPGTQQHIHTDCQDDPSLNLNTANQCEGHYHCEYSYEYEENGRVYVFEAETSGYPDSCLGVYEEGFVIKVWVNPDNPAAHIMEDPRRPETQIWARVLGLISGIVGLAALGWMARREVYLFQQKKKKKESGPEQSTR